MANRRAIFGAVNIDIAVVHIGGIHAEKIEDTGFHDAEPAVIVFTIPLICTLLSNGRHRGEGRAVFRICGWVSAGGDLKRPVLVQYHSEINAGGSYKCRSRAHVGNCLRCFRNGNHITGIKATRAPCELFGRRAGPRQNQIVG